MTWTVVSEQTSGWANAGRYKPNAVKINGGQARAASIDGQANSKLLTASVWYRLDEDLPNIVYLWSTRLAPSVELSLGAGGFNRLQFKAERVGFPSRIASYFADSDDFVVQNEWHHVEFSLDLTDAAKRHFRFNGADAGGTWEDYDDEEMDFTPGDQWRIAGMSQSPQAAYFRGALSEIWIAPGVYQDLDSNPNLFRDTNGFPVRLGVNGTNSAGATPLIYLASEAESWLKNSGAGSDFDIIVDGTVADTQGPGSVWQAQSEAGSGWTVES